jgi:hypothetical protein
MDSEKSNRIGIGLFIAVLVGIFIKFGIIDHKRLYNNHRFTIATITRIESSDSGGPLADFYYVVMGKKYTGYLILGNKKDVKVGDRYYIKFYPPNPNTENLIMDKPVPISIRTENAPVEGWATLPEK